MREFGQWLKAIGRHWIAVLGGGVVALVQLAYGLRYQSSPPLITWVILLACLFAATFLGWRDEHRKATTLERAEQIKVVLDKAFEMLKSPSNLMPFHALYAAGAANLVTNAQVVEVADKISEHHDHPMQWMEKYVHRDEWLSFLQWGKRHPDLNFERGVDYFKGMSEWAIARKRGTEESIGKEMLQGMADL
jgi:hypothetical protein